MKATIDLDSWHVSRRWTGPDDFPECNCPRAACGYAIPTATCPQHSLAAGKTLRNSHPPEACPGDRACPHCPDGHPDPASRPWGVFVAAERDGDGQPTHLHVAPTAGQHVAESDAEWVRQQLNQPTMASPLRDAITRYSEGTGSLSTVLALLTRHEEAVRDLEATVREKISREEGQ